MLDIAVSYNRYRFLGNEFLTWLWFVIETGQQSLKKDIGLEGIFEIGNRMVFENRKDGNVNENITIKGDAAGMEEGMVALKKGAMVAELNLLYKTGDKICQFTIKGESFHLSQIRFPESDAAGKKNEMESHVLEKILWCENIYSILDGLYKNFIKMRISGQWAGDILPKLRSWIESSLVLIKPV